MRFKKVCFKCGFMETQEIDICPICGNAFADFSYFDGKKVINMHGDQRIQWLEEKIGHPLSPELDAKRREYQQMLYAEASKSIDDRQKQQAQEQRQKNLIQMQKRIDKANCIPKCPICGSTNVNKISVTKRAIKIVALGTIGALDDAGKTYQCGNCGSKF